MEFKYFQVERHARYTKLVKKRRTLENLNSNSPCPVKKKTVKMAVSNWKMDQY